MDKIEMRKHIPKNTPYCYTWKNRERIFCPWRKHVETVKLDKSSCEFADVCNKACWSSVETKCKLEVFRCEYLDYTDYKEESLLWDACKECDVD